MTDSVFMSDELQGKIELDDSKTKLVPDYDPNTMLWVRLTAGGKKSKKLPVKFYDEHPEYPTPHRKMELLLERDEFLSVAQNRPTGYVLLAGDDTVAEWEISTCAKLSASARDGVFHVWLTF